MERFVVKSFVNWLDQATNEEILQRRLHFEDALKNPMIRSAEAKSDIRLGIRLIDEELVVRLEVFQKQA